VKKFLWNIPLPWCNTIGKEDNFNKGHNSGDEEPATALLTVQHLLHT
jgi:hypothetical protein